MVQKPGRIIVSRLQYRSYWPQNHPYWSWYPFTIDFLIIRFLHYVHKPIVLQNYRNIDRFKNYIPIDLLQWRTASWIELSESEGRLQSPGKDPTLVLGDARGELDLLFFTTQILLSSVFLDFDLKPLIFPNNGNKKYKYFSNIFRDNKLLHLLKEEHLILRSSLPAVVSVFWKSDKGETHGLESLYCLTKGRRKPSQKSSSACTIAAVDCSENGRLKSKSQSSFLNLFEAGMFGSISMKKDSSDESIAALKDSLRLSRDGFRFISQLYEKLSIERGLDESITN